MKTNEAVILSAVKRKASSALQHNKRFHDFGHGVEVCRNAESLLKTVPRSEEVDSLTILTAALLHDLSDFSDDREGPDGAEKADKILRTLRGFPQGKIPDVKRLIMAHRTKTSVLRKTGRLDEKILKDADRMAICSTLSICRGILLDNKQGMDIQQSIDNMLRLEAENHRKLFFEESRTLVSAKRKQFRKFLIECARNYEL